MSGYANGEWICDEVHKRSFMKNSFKCRHTKMRSIRLLAFICNYVVQEEEKNPASLGTQNGDSECSRTACSSHLHNSTPSRTANRKLSVGKGLPVHAWEESVKQEEKENVFGTTSKSRTDPLGMKNLGSSMSLGDNFRNLPLHFLSVHIRWGDKQAHMDTWTSSFALPQSSDGLHLALCPCP